MSNKDHAAKGAAELAMGAVQDLSRRGGFNAGSPHGPAGKAAELLVTGAAYVAPVVVAKVGVVTAGSIAAATAGAAAVATVAAPLVIVGAIGFGVYKLFKSR